VGPDTPGASNSDRAADGLLRGAGALVVSSGPLRSWWTDADPGGVGVDVLVIAHGT
jgi:hypothetical protein